MKAGIIAAGKGSRLAAGGILTPKPLVQVGGQTLVARALHEAAGAGAERAALITSPAFPEVAAYLRGGTWPLPVDLTVWDSPNSLESFLALAPYLDCPFLLLTVDAVFAPGAVGRFVTQARSAPARGALGLTTFQEDESPLYVHLDPEGRITAVGGPDHSGYITAGCYYFQPEVFQWQPRAQSLGLTALRQFLAMLAQDAYPLVGLDVGSAVDVDRPGDLARAEELLLTGRLPCPP